MWTHVSLRRTTYISRPANTSFLQKIQSMIAAYQNMSIIQVILTALSLVVVYMFALWWFSFTHIPQNFIGYGRLVDILLFIAVSYIIWHPIIMDILTWSIASYIKDPQKQTVQPGLKVAFITTIVPGSESISLLHQCLPAMKKASYDHDTWLLDEGNDPDVKKICEQYGVMHFSRRGKRRYNTPHGKYSAKTKGGNHNSWYDEFGNTYDFVAQIDTDFVPKRTFLTETLGYFKDPTIAFVGTPQVYGNVDESLIARGAAEQLYSFYGAILRGLSGMGTTLLIGANHIIRVAALKDVDHYSAHITEDLLTGMKLHNKDWRSVYVPAQLAVGEGPVTWEAYFNQQMRWAYGCMDILFRRSAGLYKGMTVQRALYYFFLQQYYFSGIAMALSICLLAVYFTTGIQVANVDVYQFIEMYGSVVMTRWLMQVWLRKFYVDDAKDKLFLFSGWIVGMAVWPIYFLAFLSSLFGKRLTYKITPKGEQRSGEETNSSVFIPHTIFGGIALIGVISSFYTHRQDSIMMFWAVCTFIFMFLVPHSQGIIRDGVLVWKGFREFIASLKEIFYTSRTYTHVSSVAPINERMIDTLFLSVMSIASLVLYVSKLGFYSDDWSFISNFKASHDQSIIGLFKTATTPNTFMRPIQNLYDALLYWGFGSEPFGYHIVNALVITGSAVVLYAALRRLRMPRIIAVSLPLVFTLLPNYSTDRFWYAAFQANLSVLWFVSSLYCGIRAFSTSRIKRSLWKLFSLACMILSILSYEVLIPLFFLNAVWIWTLEYHGKFKKAHLRDRAKFIVMTFVIIVGGIAFKSLTTTRLSNPPIQHMLDIAPYITNIIASALQVNVGVWGVFLLQTVWEMVRQSTLAIVMSAIGIGLISCVYLYSIVSTSELPDISWMRKFTLLGVGVIILGYAIFFTNTNVAFSPTGIANRVSIAAALGVACLSIGSIGWITRKLFSERVAKFVFSAALSFVVACGFLIINTISLYWISAYKDQQRVLETMSAHVATLPAKSSVMLDGICPYVGPAPVFEAFWDFKGALQLRYHDQSLQADIITPRVYTSQDGLHTQIYNLKSSYPYENLYIYNAAEKRLVSIPDESAAKAYFSAHNPKLANGCPSAVEGEGVAIL